MRSAAAIERAGCAIAALALARPPLKNPVAARPIWFVDMAVSRSSARLAPMWVRSLSKPTSYLIARRAPVLRLIAQMGRTISVRAMADRCCRKLAARAAAPDN
jgi:hypothetical protein